MENFWQYVLSGSVFVAIIKLIESIVVWALNRKSKKEDSSAESQCVTNQRHDSEIAEITNTMDDVKCSVMLIMQDRIEYLAYQYIARDSISIRELKRINRMHDLYHNRLNGNGDLDDVMALVHKLQVRKGE